MELLQLIWCSSAQDGDQILQRGFADLVSLRLKRFENFDIVETFDENAVLLIRQLCIAKSCGVQHLAGLGGEASLQNSETVASAQLLLLDHEPAIAQPFKNRDVERCLPDAL